LSKVQGRLALENRIPATQRHSPSSNGVVGGATGTYGSVG
jgi:hypothetical protein